MKKKLVTNDFECLDIKKEVEDDNSKFVPINKKFNEKVN